MIADDLRSNIKLNKILGAHAVIRCVSLTYMRVLLSYCISAKKDDKICVHQSTPAWLSWREAKLILPSACLYR
jgi:hypothetical protein